MHASVEPIPIATCDRGDGTRLAYRHRRGNGPTLVFLPGYKSDMAGGKATAVDQWAAAHGRACLLLDYAGCGASEGRFTDYTLADWRDDALAVVRHATTGRVVLIGSSMGGWLMLLVAQALQAERGPDAVAALVGIAAAPDFTQWGFDDAQRAILLTEGVLLEASPYSDEPTATTRAFWESGQALLQLDAPIAFNGSVRLLHGQRDDDVPFAISLRLAEALTSDDVRVTLIKDGDHRLSRDGDIALLLQTLAELSA